MSKKILLADDSITIQKVIELTFSDEDFEVVTVGNGRLAIERVQDVRPDLVLCDIIMPEKDGYEVCDFIKKNPALSRTPVLLLTGAFEPFDQERATRVGCDGFLAKPFEPQTLIAKVKDLLGRAAAPAPTAATATPASAVTVAAMASPFALSPTPSAPAVSSPAPAAAPAPASTAAVPSWSTHASGAPPPSAAAREPEPFAFVPEPPAAYEPPPPATPVLPFEEAGVSFFTEETLMEAPGSKSPPASAGRGDTAPVPTFPETPDFEEFRASTFDEVASSPTVALTPPPTAAPAPVPAPTPASRPAPVAEARPAAARSGFPALDEEDGPQTLLNVSVEEAATLRGEQAPAARVPAPPPAVAPPARTPPRSPLWTQQTMEVPLETRARASMEAVHLESEPVFEEVFDTTVPPARPTAPAPMPVPAPTPAFAAASRPAPPAVEPPREPTAVPRPPAPAPVATRMDPAPAPMAARVETPAPAPPPKPAPVAAAAAPAPAPPFTAVQDRPASVRRPDDPATLSVPAASTSDGTAVRSSVPSAAPAEAAAAAGGAANLSVPVDMVSQIAQRVVAQISEKVIREVAWEVIPDLAEVLIKKEIERLKAELQRT